jgi:hypothetical protein
VIGHVVAMGQEHEAHAAQRGEPRQERPGGARRVDEDVPSEPLDQIRRGAVRLLARVAAVMDGAVDALRKSARSLGRLPRRADGGGRARDQCHQRAQALGLACRLPAHVGGAAPLGEDRGRQLAAGVAVDAGRVDEQLAGGVLRQSEIEPGHGSGVTERP